MTGSGVLAFQRFSLGFFYAGITIPIELKTNWALAVIRYLIFV
jgi:hypothetical protein